MRSDSSSGCSPGTPIQEKDSRLPDLLRHARERRGLTLEQLSSDTKIPASRLAAFERDDVPGNDRGFYLRAQIRAYARALHVDDGVVRAALNRESAASPPQAAPVEESRPRMPALRVPRAPVAIGLVIAAIVAGRLMATLDFSPAEDAGVQTLPDSLPPSETPVPTTAADVPQVESSQAAAAGSFENAPGLELQALRASPAPEGGGSPAAAAGTSATANAVTELVVTSEPAGARVTVNGIGWGATPITIRHLPAGPKRVRLTMDGFTAAERVVSVDPERPRSLDVRLSPVAE